MDSHDMGSESQKEDEDGVHVFYFVKHFPSVEEPGIKFDIEETKRLILKLHQARHEISEKLQILKSNEYKLSWRYWCYQRCRYGNGGKKNEIELLKTALDELYNNSNSKKSTPPKATHIRSPTEELRSSDYVAGLYRQIHCGSVNLVKERQFIRQIKLARAESEKTITDNDDMVQVINKYYNVMKFIGSKKAITDRIKVLRRELKEEEMNHLGHSAHSRSLGDKKKTMENDIRMLQREVENIDMKKLKAYERISQLKSHLDKAVKTNQSIILA